MVRKGCGVEGQLVEPPTAFPHLDLVQKPEMAFPRGLEKPQPDGTQSGSVSQALAAEQPTSTSIPIPMIAGSGVSIQTPLTMAQG